MLTVAALNEYLGLDGADSPAFLAIYSRVVTMLSAKDRMLLDQLQADKRVKAEAEKDAK